MIDVCDGCDFVLRRDTEMLRLFFDIGVGMSEIALLDVDDVDLGPTSSGCSARGH